MEYASRTRGSFSPFLRLGGAGGERTPSRPNRAEDARRHGSDSRDGRYATDKLSVWGKYSRLGAPVQAPTGYDRRHMFTMGWVYELPIGKGQKFPLSGVADRILGGWKVNGTFAKYTGTPFTVTGSSTSLRCARGCGTQMADQIAPVQKIDTERGPGKPYYDPASFIDPLVQWNKDGIRSGQDGADGTIGPRDIILRRRCR